MNKVSLLLVGAFVLISFPFVSAIEDGSDILLGGLELDKVLTAGSAFLATALCILTFLAYQRSKNNKLVYVGTAFGFFAIKGYLIASELVIGEYSWIDPVSTTLDFVILLTFFIGILRK